MVADADRPLRFARIIESLRPDDGPCPTGRELAAGYIIIAEGLSYFDAGRRLAISPKTVDTQVRQLAERLDLSGVRELRAAVTRALWDRVA